MDKKWVSLLVISFFIFALGWSLYSVFKIVSTLAPDFGILWNSAYDLLNNRNPYTNPNSFTINAYPPVSLIFYFPLTLIKYKLAQMIFTILSFLTIFGSVALCLKVIFKKFEWLKFFLFSSLALISFPIKFTLGMGQINIIAVYILLISYYFYGQKKYVYSGLVFGAACLLKPVLSFVIIYFLLKRDWKLILYSLIIPALATSTILLLFGSDSFIYWFTDIIPKLSATVGGEIYYNQSITGFISRIFFIPEIRKYLIVFTSLPVFLYPIYLLVRKADEDLQFSLLIVTLLLVNTISWQHHFVWTIFPFIVSVKYAVKLNKNWVWVFLGFAYLLVSWNFKQPNFFQSFPASFLLSNTFYGGFILYFLLIFFQRSVGGKSLLPKV